MKKNFAIRHLIVLLFAAISVAGYADDYDSLDQAIESEIEGIDFSDLDQIDDEQRILGNSVIDYEILAEFVRSHNAGFDSEIARHYIEVGRKYGLRGDIAFCQAILETGWFRFADGTAVRPSQHNYCGLGVLKRGQRGEKFPTIKKGVIAHIQHLYAYVTKADLPKGETLLDPRFRLIKRGCASTWHELSNRWAMNPVYGKKILKIFNELKEFSQQYSTATKQ